MHYLLFYEFVEDMLEKRKPFREGHLRHAKDAVARGELVLGGALLDPVDGGVLQFDAPSPEIPEKFAAADPYVTGGLVVRWRVRRWMTVVGGEADSPIK